MDFKEKTSESSSNLEKSLIELKSKISEKRASNNFTTESVLNTKSSLSAKTKTEAKNEIESLSRLNRFEYENISSSNEHPTLLTRIPIFLPITRSKQSELYDQDNALRFNTSWGQGRRFGPPLSTYDEDTMIAIGLLRQFKISGHDNQFPIPKMSMMSKLHRDEISVHAVCCLLSDIQNTCKTSVGGRTNKLRLESLKRLGATVIELTSKNKERYSEYGTSIKLLDIAWEEYEKNSLLYIQFSPIMSYWYDKEYTYIDWNIRLQLTDTGKTIHRFFSSQPKKYEIGCLKLSQSLYYSRPFKKFMADLRLTLNKLVELGWLKKFNIVGNGRKVPFKLEIIR